VRLLALFRGRMLRWQWCSLAELKPAELYAVLAMRSRVFVVEQQCAYQDADGHDLAARHLIAWTADRVAAYLRVLEPGSRYDERSVGRVLTAPELRGTGLGRLLMARALEALDDQLPGQPIRLGAQAHLERFYGSFGFVVVSDVYLEDGIPHIEMRRTQAPGGGSAQEATPDPNRSVLLRQVASNTHASAPCARQVLCCTRTFLPCPSAIIVSMYPTISRQRL
jgi:ElaA protein